jgi:leucyl aminopeptidase
MEIKLVRGNTSFKTGALIIPIFEDLTSSSIPQDLIDSGEVAAKPLEFTLLHQAGEGGPRRILLAGAGKSGSFGPAELRKLSAAAVRFLKSKSITDAVFALSQSLSTAPYAKAAVEGAILGNFEPDQNKSDKTASKFIASFSLAVEADGSLIAGADGLEAAVEEARILAESQNAARALGNEPPNRLTPLALAAHAKKMADEFGLGCEILDRERMTQLGFGALLGVAMGSAEPPVLIILRYVPANPAAAGTAHLGLVGKAVTFDSGGISIKPADGMEQMKFDMMGGATVISAMQAIAQLKPSIPVTAVVASVENMLGARAQRPSDIVTTLSGKTVEVLNTDAEGRMILADALTYTQRLGCTHMVNAATLTGAIVVALGHTFTGVFGNDAAFLERWMVASLAEHERMWKMPIDDDFKERLKSSFADMQNIGGRYGGASIAANFLKEFADPTPWVHLDIAGTAWLEESKAWMAKGATGCPTRTFVRLAMDWK